MPNRAVVDFTRLNTSTFECLAALRQDRRISMRLVLGFTDDPLPALADVQTALNMFFGAGSRIQITTLCEARQGPQRAYAHKRYSLPDEVSYKYFIRPVETVSRLFGL
jgi:hypothetical protein